MANIVLDFLHNYQTGERRESEPANAYQYDEGHVLEAVLPEVITSCEIHYWIRGMEEADAYTLTSITPNSDGSCTVLGNIPNSYFETNGELRIYIVVTDGTASITTYEGKLHICQRSMPDDYVDDDPENEAVRVITEARAAAATATEKAGEAAESAEQAQEILDSIPADYTQMSEDVDTLKADTSTLKEDLQSAEIALTTKAEIDGYYEDMTVGDAEQLVSTVTNADDTPYNFRTTGGSADVGDRAYVDAIVGGTMCVNQLVENGNFASDSGWHDNGNVSLSVANNIATMTTTIASGDRNFSRNINKPAPTGHKLFVSVDMKVSEASTPQAGVYGVYARKSLSADTWETCSVIGNVTSTASLGYAVVYAGNVALGGTVDVKNFYAVDLTQMFGSTIADYVYSLETATAGAGVAWLKANAPKIFDGGYIPFNAGTLQSVVGLSEKRNTGLNQWDEEYVNGFFNDSGVYTARADIVGSKNAIRVLPNTVYCFKGKASAFVTYWRSEVSIDNAPTKEFISRVQMNADVSTFTTPADCHYIFFNMPTAYGATYNHDICINLHWDGEKDGTYEPYTLHTYAFDPTVELRGVPKLDAQNNLYYDGDEYASDGTVTRKYGIVDLGTLTWTYEQSAQRGNYFWTSLPLLKAGASLLCAKYMFIGVRPYDYSAVDKAIALENVSVQLSTYIDIVDSAYTDAATFKTAMSGVLLVCELATPTTETATPYNPVEIVDDFGTEEFITTSLVPVGHETRYAPNLRAKLEMSPDSPDGDGLYIVQQSGGENTYIPLASSSTIQNILARLTALEGNTNEG